MTVEIKEPRGVRWRPFAHICPRAAGVRPFLSGRALRYSTLGAICGTCRAGLRRLFRAVYRALLPRPTGLSISSNLRRPLVRAGCAGCRCERHQGRAAVSSKGGRECWLKHCSSERRQRITLIRTALPECSRKSPRPTPINCVTNAWWVGRVFRSRAIAGQAGGGPWGGICSGPGVRSTRDCQRLERHRAAGSGS